MWTFYFILIHQNIQRFKEIIQINPVFDWFLLTSLRWHSSINQFNLVIRFFLSKVQYNLRGFNINLQLCKSNHGVKKTLNSRRQFRSFCLFWLFFGFLRFLIHLLQFFQLFGSTKTFKKNLIRWLAIKLIFGSRLIHSFLTRQQRTKQ